MVPVQFHDGLGSCPLVQAVDVLGDDRAQPATFL